MTKFKNFLEFICLTCFCLVFSVGFIFVGLYCLHNFGQSEYFSCNRSKDSCISEYKRVFDPQKNTNFEIKLSSIIKADIATYNSNVGSARNKDTYKLILITKQGKLPLAKVSSSNYNKYKHQADKFNNFLNSNESEFKITQENKDLKIFFSIFAIFGFVISLNMLSGFLSPFFKKQNN